MNRVGKLVRKHYAWRAEEAARIKEEKRKAEKAKVPKSEEESKNGGS